MVVKKRGNKWCTIHCTGPKKGEPIACFPTKVEADTQHRAIMQSKHASKIEINLEEL